MIKTQMFIFFALIVGVGIGYFAGGHGDAPAQPSETAYAAKAAVADKGDAASMKALRRRIAELERLLAEKESASEMAISNAVAEAVKAAPPPRMNWRERMEEMKKNDPVRYTQMTNRFAQWRQHRAARTRSTMAFLSSIDTSHMSAGAKKTHAELQALLAQREDIEEALHQEDLTDEQRDELMKELHKTHHEMNRLNGEERKNLLDETARALGFSGDDANEVSTTIQEVIDATDNGWGGGRHRGGPPRPPAGGARGR